MIGGVIPEPRVTVTHVGPVFRVERLRFPGGAAGGGPSGGKAVGPEVQVAAARAGEGGGEAAVNDLVKDVVRHPGAVAVVALRDDGMLVLVRNRRVAVGRELLEFCAGKLEPGEEPASAAARELEEETGHAASTMTPLGTFFTSPGFTDEKMHVFEATGLRNVPQRLEPGEDLEVVAMEVAAFERLVSEGAIEDGKSLGAYLLWRTRGTGAERRVAPQGGVR